MITWLNPKRGSRPIDQHIGAKIKVYANHQLCITLNESLMKSARLYVGDRVNVGFDDDYVYIVRSQDGGYTLSTNGAKKDGEFYGKHALARLKMSSYSERDWPEAEIPLSEIILDDKLYTVVIPRRIKSESHAETSKAEHTKPLTRGK